jgi:hypothetical protein
VAFRVGALGRTPAGRGKVQLQVEVKPFGAAFNGTGLITGPSLDTGAPGSSGSVVALSQLVNGLLPSSLSHWRARIVTDSPFFPRSRWLWTPYNGVTEADLRGLTDASTYSAYTGVGTNVQVTLTSALIVTFDQVTADGITSVTWESTGPPPPTGFQIVPLSPPLYADVSTTATFTDSVTVCLAYDEADVTGNESDLKVLHYDVGIPDWVDVTSSLDTNANVLCGRTATLSPFVIVEPDEDTGVLEATTVAFGLSAVSPSPFRGTTSIEFGLPQAGPARVRIFDVTGRLVRTLAQGPREAGRHKLAWDGRDARGEQVASGVYFVRLEALGREQMRRVVRVK